jgi:Holliday junction resolvase
MVNSRKKGSRNERNLSKVFQQWTGYEFTRVPSSGGLRWQRKKDTVGDLICSDDKHSRYFTFSIEAKVRKVFTLNELLLPINKDTYQFFDQAKKDADRANKIPLLFIRCTGMPKDFHFVVLDLHYFNEVVKGIIDNKCGRIIFRGTKELAIFPSTDFFETNYKDVHKLTKTYIKTWKKSGSSPI